MPAVKIADLILLYLPLKYINSAIKPVTIKKGIDIQVIPVTNIKSGVYRKDTEDKRCDTFKDNERERRIQNKL